MQVVTSLTRPVSLLRWKLGYRQPPASTTPQQTTTTPPAGSLSHASGVPAPSRRELFSVSFCVFTLDFCELEVPAVNPSGKNQRLLPAPTGREPFCAWYRHCLKSNNPGKHGLSGGFSYFRRELPAKTGLDFPKQAGLFLLPGMILPPFPGKNQQEPEKTL